ncbi:phosphate ABC transporter substrate-binding protein [Pigmentiphaga litoralis]|uniref:4,5-dihydroxyphthalate decarboxylase n=1 Tax=Pigmentiphaga litoralis TaxID=516702 RepID=A0A7Y9IT67_9BURK|nr:phosphate ABC transporter substrate-binding protein [Pigmentiphaga litoralis]NYE23754.1 4,5-dihydroxyphthalate decarboxylase [Pigmentiphaga litoralis]NYE82632.1 4,5-dihydroxyphthalate decarboxylase [Pigmentiphaga litoralis]
MSTADTRVLTLKTNLADSPVVAAMKDGRITSDLVQLDFCGPKTAHDGFKPMIRNNDFDAGELAIVTYLQAKAFGKPFVMLPAPVVGRFQHHCIGFNKEFGHLNPKDIEGKKVGVRSYAQTTGLWVRGILQHEHGVDLDKVTWMTIDDSHLAEYQDPPNCQRLPKGSSIPQMMLDGELAAAILGNDMPKDPRVQTLIPEPIAAAKAWYEREHVVPINHVFVVHQDISRKHPEVVRDIYRMIKESRALAPESALATLPPLGLEANRKGLEMAIDWSYEQKIIPRKFSVDELFDDVTGSLD